MSDLLWLAAFLYLVSHGDAITRLIDRIGACP